LWQGRLWTLRPVTVVEDTPQLVALYIAPGTRWKRPLGLDGEKLRMPAEQWQLGNDVWRGAALRLTRPTDAHSVLLLWTESGELTCWYINLEEPLRRSPVGFDYMDQALDIVVGPDLSWWRWKDEEEMADAVAKGIFSRQQAAQIRAEGERALERLLSRAPPLDRPWERWVPDPNWGVPALSEDWTTVAQT
jgi:hypothetical protein